MKKRYVPVLPVLVCLCLLAGCGSNQAVTPSADTAATAANSAADVSGDETYLGDWCLAVSQDGDLYRLTALYPYFGSTQISLDEMDGGHVKGSITSVSGAPGNREANIDFEGDLVDGMLTASYEDTGWSYSGELELTFGTDGITAKITRDPSDSTTLWGIPEGQFTFIRPIETETLIPSDDETAHLLNLFSAVTEEMIAPFAEGGLTDEALIDFVGCNLGLGTAIDLSEFGDKITTGSEIVFDESVLDDLTERYFGTEVTEDQSTDIVTYQNGTYSVPALGGITAYPTLQTLMRDTNQDDIYYAVVDYMLDSPDVETTLEYEYLIQLQKDEDFIIKSIQKVSSPIDFEFLDSLPS